MKKFIIIACLALVLPLTLASVSFADVKFTRLSEDQFIVHHRKLTTLGAEAKAVKTAYKEAASICVAASYTHFEIKEQNVGERMHGTTFGGGRGASADIRVKFYQDPDEEAIDEKDLIECKPLSDPKKVKRAKEKLAKDSSAR